MFDELLKNPLVLYLPQVIPVVVGILLSRIIELVPKFARWWDRQPDEYKYAYRGWAGLVVAIALVAFAHFAGLYQFDLGTVADWLLLAGAIIVAWVEFLGSAEGTYQVTRNRLPRKQGVLL